ncbi:MAG: hypothetical protein KIT72_12680 [Polyangiaceae bacterium]|nr:hypothetical protein [Polyangiaceae bacterium]MCW5791268.1 hypothetical protein [Polyangiaceae bacterium]
MSDELKAWLRQARADLEASRQTVLAECHRRYLLQQAYEKGVKALGLRLWRGSLADADFRRLFLHRHDPLSRLQAEADLAKALRIFLRQINSELSTLDNAGLLLRVDGTSPTTNRSDVSYRYPFIDSQTGSVIAPVDISTDDWDAYQGNEMGVARAIERFLKRVESLIRRSRGA